MTATPASSPPVSAALVDCRTCGACCDYSALWPRFSLETDADIARIPDDLVARDGGGMRCTGHRCAALAGTIGKLVACTIYDVRPLVCRDCLPGDAACNLARERHGLAAIIDPDVLA
jgi:Fe-S-cluster containining protein